MPRGSPSPAWEVQKSLTEVSSQWSKPSQARGKVSERKMTVQAKARRQEQGPVWDTRAKEEAESMAVWDQS